MVLYRLITSEMMKVGHAAHISYLALVAVKIEYREGCKLRR